MTKKPVFDDAAANRRKKRGIIIAAHCKLHNHNGVWFVPSQSGGDKRIPADYLWPQLQLGRKLVPIAKSRFGS